MEQSIAILIAIFLSISYVNNSINKKEERTAPSWLYMNSVD